MGRFSLQRPFMLENTLIYVENISVGEIRESIPTHSHGSGCYEIHLVPQGSGVLETATDSYTLKGGSLYVTGPHVAHAQRSNPGDSMREYCVYLRMETLGRTPAPVLDSFCSRDFWLGEDSGEADMLMRRLMAELDGGQLGAELQIQSLLCSLVIVLARRYREGQGREAAASPAPARLSLLIENSFLQDSASLSLTALAERLHLSPRQTQRLLRQYYQQSFQELKLQARMARARTLLLESALPVSVIAEQLGFYAPEHFSHTFKRYTGCSPTAYRRRSMGGV